jgi:hypothetical protein
VQDRAAPTDHHRDGLHVSRGLPQGGAECCDAAIGEHARAEAGRLTGRPGPGQLRRFGASVVLVAAGLRMARCVGRALVPDGPGRAPRRGVPGRPPPRPCREFRRQQVRDVVVLAALGRALRPARTRSPPRERCHRRRSY